MTLAVVHAENGGEKIYREGLLQSGQPLVGLREGNAAVSGADAACVNCHRRSGLGSTEGRISIPPIAGAYLFRSDQQRIDDQAVPFVGGARIDHKAYSDESLARAIREGTAATGRHLNYLMPRYALDEASMSHLIAYLKEMNPGRAPGVSDSVLHFATVITPDSDPVARQGMLDVLEKYFQDKNAAARAVAPRLYSSRPMMFKVTRKWQLHVWTLTGPPEGWRRQLETHLAQEPVFAVISGLGGATWEPIHRFCHEEAVPCLFPNVDAPVDDEGDFYSVYFSRGVLLEAQLIARQLQGREIPGRGKRIVQVFRAGDVGERAALAFRTAHLPDGLRVDDHRLRRDGGTEDLRSTLSTLSTNDIVVLWLRGKDLAALPHLQKQPAEVWMSGLMGGLENAPLPQEWRAGARMAYPVDMPEKRRVRVDYAFGWFTIRHIPIVAPRVQADTYLACGLLSETLNHMVETFERDYLIERIEAGLDHRVLTGYYPRLTLSPGQRFASKGGYVARFADPQGSKILPLSDWIAP